MGWLALTIHRYSTYTLLGIPFVFLVGLLLVLGQKANPLIRSKVLFIGVALPWTALAVIHGVFPALGIEWRPDPQGWGSLFLAWACSGGYWSSRIILPFLPLIVVMASRWIWRPIWLAYNYRKRWSNYHGPEREKAEEVISLATEALGVPSPEVVIVPNTAPVAFVTGWRRPLVVFSCGLVRNLSPHELLHVAAHEVAHIRQGDDLLTRLMGFLRDMAFYSPLVFPVFQAWKMERDMAADDLAVTVTGDYLGYAATLLKVWRLGQPKNFHLPLPAGTNFLWPARGIVARAERLLGEALARDGDGRWWRLLPLTILLTGMALVSLAC
ncbi:MAG: hypothetical protein PWP65_1616 [Clostridia bacterium]|nr:hypothetical protein [Clostridia bacterium]